MSQYTKATYEITNRVKSGRPIVCLTSSMVYEVGFLGSNWKLSADPGYCTDLTSIPQLPRCAPAIVVRFRDWCSEQLAPSAIPHDIMRENKKWPKILSDYVMFEAAGVTGVPLWLRLIAFGIVLINFDRY